MIYPTQKKNNSCQSGPDSEHTAREVLSLQRGRWHLLALSHSLPYLSLLKRSQVRACVVLHGGGLGVIMGLSRQPS